MVIKTIVSGLLCLLMFSSVAHSSQDETKPAQEADPIAIKPPEGMVPANLVLWNEGPNHSRYAIIADKGQRTLSVWENKGGIPKLVEAHPMDMGKNDGDKTQLGDHKTPEGIYFPQQIFEGPTLNFEEYGIRAFELDYPNFFDKRENKTGSGIWLHAIPDTKSLMRGSRGCVVVRNAIIKHLTPMIDLKTTPIVILKKVSYVDTNTITTKAKSLKEWLENWRQAWTSKDIEKYIDFYAEDFRSQKMDRETWRRYKTELNKRYENIHVQTYNPVAFQNGKEAIIRFVQEYRSDYINDFGQKTLYLSFDGNSYKIRGEKWERASSDILAQLGVTRSTADTKN